MTESKRKQKVLEAATQIIEDGEKPSARKISQKLGYPDQDVHRCLNTLERQGKLKSYKKTFEDNNYRFISLYRE
jgi:DNA-binding IclR family transcriptional regulator